MANVLKSLNKILTEKKNFSSARIIKTLKILNSFSFVLTDSLIPISSIFIEKLAFFCNANLKHHVHLKLKTSKYMLESWIASAKLSGVDKPVSLIKLLIITNLNLSFYFQKVLSWKSVKYALDALKSALKYKFHSNRGQILNFVCRLRLSEIYILNAKFEIGIKCCENLLSDVLKKLEKRNKKKAIREIAMTAITAFYRIGKCKELIGQDGQQAFQMADKIGVDYLRTENILENLQYEQELFGSVKNIRKKSICAVKSAKSKVSHVGTFEEVSRVNSPDSILRSKSNELIKKNKTNDIIKLDTKKYYSQQELEKLNKILDTENSEKIVTTDQYFFQKITKQLGINLSSINNPLSTSVSLMDSQKSEINSLRNRRNLNLFKSEEIQPEKIDEKIDRFEVLCESNMKLQQTKLKSTLKTKVYQSILKSINLSCSSKPNQIPAQRLHFSPPINPDFIYFTKRMSIVRTKAKEFNNEIEDQLGQLNKEFRMSKEGICAKNLELPKNSIKNKGKISFKIQVELS